MRAAGSRLRAGSARAFGLQALSAHRALGPTAARAKSACAAPAATTLHILLYNYVDDVQERRVPFRARHLAAAHAAEARGDLLLGGALADPLDGAVLVFSGGDEAESFAQADPYVLEGIVESWTVREWTTVAGSLLAQVPARPFPTYEWQRISQGAEVPAGLEVVLPLDGKHGRARIPPTWQLAVWMDDTRGFWRDWVTRETTVRELRQSAAAHAGVAPELIELRLNEVPMDDESMTVERLELFGREGALRVLVKE